MEGDSQSYLEFSDYRPHGYPLFLAFHRLIFGSLTHLPLVQATFYYLAIWVLAFAMSRGAGGWLFAPVFALVAVSAPFLDFGGVMSDTSFAAWLALGMAAFLLYRSSDRPVFLAAASFCFGFAAITRTIGYVALAIYFFVIALLLLKRWRHELARLIAAIAPAIVLLFAAAASNYSQNGEFRIGSWGGVALLGKGLVSATPLPPADKLSRFNWIPPKTSPARVALRDVHSLPLKMLLVRQYYEYLRYQLVWKELDRREPSWRDATDPEREAFARLLAKAYIKNDPATYAELVLLDYLSMWTVPRLLTPTECAALGSEYDRLTYLPYLREFAQTKEGSIDYYRVVPAPSSISLVYLVRLASGAFALVTLAVAIFLLVRTREFFSRNCVDLFLPVAIVNGCYLATAVMEGGFERYVSGTWPLLSSALFVGLNALTYRNWKARKCVTVEATVESQHRKPTDSHWSD